MNMNIMSRTRSLATEADLHDERDPDGRPEAGAVRRPTVLNWLLDDSPYIAMLLLTLVGIVLRMPVDYWVVMTPMFAIISIVAGWRNFRTREDHTQLLYSQALSWLAVVVAIYILGHASTQEVLNSNATSIALMTMLALGTVIAGLQARVWRICAVGGILFLAVPGMGWVDQSAVLLVVATVVVIAVGGLTWWMDQRRRGLI
jgi:hypothetical protein